LETIAQGSNDAAIEEATKKLRRKVDQLQTALEKSRSELATARKQKQVVDTRLQETSSKLENAQKEIESSKGSEHQVRAELAHTQASLEALQSSQESSTAEQLRAQIADLKNQLVIAEEARATAEKQRDETNAKLAEANNEIAAVERQRDQALAELKTASETKQHVQVLLGRNGDLEQKPGNTEEDVAGNDDSVNAGELAAVKQQVTQLQQQLAESQKQNQYLTARIGELWVQLDETGAQLQNAKLSGKNSEETDRLIRENELLRSIVVRERQEEARRDEARKMLLAELDRLNIKSDALNQQIEFLAQPVIKLNSEELSLLRQPVVSVSDQGRAGLTASFIFAKKSAADSAEDQSTITNSGGFKEDVRDESQSVAHAGRESFDGPSGGRQKAAAANPDPGSQ
jgi:chromosome segregation ATPase